jgi:cytochrome P450
MTLTSRGPTSDVDLFADESLADPYPLFASLRDAGPAVHLTGPDMWFLGRYDVVKRALEDWETFSSGQGVGMTPQFNDAMASALICLDPPDHAPQRKLFTERLSPKALRSVRETIDIRSRAMIQELRGRDHVDAVSDLAHDLPVNVIMDLVGWPQDVRAQLVPMAEAWFQTIGPMNDRCAHAWPQVGAMVELVTAAVVNGTPLPGSFGDHMVQAHRAGAIPLDAAVGLLIGYVVAAFDTTINAISSAVVLLARNPEQWAALRARPALATNAFSEVIRLESPIQYFTRVTTRDVDLGDGVVVPAGARTLISYGAANRDSRHFDRPDEFDVTRPLIDHLAFSAGVHACAGQNLARMEGQAVLQALATELDEIVLVGEPVLALNNAGRGYARVPVRLT